MNCKKIKARLDLLAGDDLAGRDAAEVEAHLRTCLACYREYVSMRDLLAEVRASGRTETPRAADAGEALVAAVMDRIEGPPPAAPRLLPRLAMASGWAAALLLGLTLGWYRWHLDSARSGGGARSRADSPEVGPSSMDTLIETDLRQQIDQLRGTAPAPGAGRGESVHPALHRALKNF
jgi:anti-sigma factor RsiW